jgi:hypothetical protein
MFSLIVNGMTRRQQKARRALTISTSIMPVLKTSKNSHHLNPRGESYESSHLEDCGVLFLNLHFGRLVEKRMKLFYFRVMKRTNLYIIIEPF